MWCLGVSFLLLLGPSVAQKPIKLGHYNISSSSNASTFKSGKVLSLFNIVTFKNDICVTASDTAARGTCLTSTECSGKGGRVDGNCAAGFGVCCLFRIAACGGTVNQNCTYIQNAEFPNSAAASTSCTFTFSRICPNLCQIRLDFQNLVTAQPPTAGAGTTGACATSGDFLTVTSPTSSNPPVVCGTLSGQHMFFETGSTGNAGTAAFTFGTTASTKTYQVKVTYYQCTSRNRAPADCVQYFTGTSGTVMSYNYPNQMLSAQEYASCFRQEQGYCSISFNQSPSTGTDTFDLYRENTHATTAIGEIGNCQLTSLSIPTTDVAGSLYCGGVLTSIDGNTAENTVSSTFTPFQVNTLTINALGDGAPDAILGYSVDFVQQPC